ncbi:PTS beta-glucoside transporter subunit IIBCA, partial [Streptococcus pneumoniae]|nr:PTS beta-glucoside transporter subunit IIBCA [Streptococcus pneumoniae]
GNGQLAQYLLMVAVSFALGFALTYMFGYEDEVEEAAGAITEAETDRLTEEAVTGTVVSPSEGVIQTPIVGDAVALSNVNDPVFSSGAMG